MSLARAGWGRRYANFVVRQRQREVADVALVLRRQWEGMREDGIATLGLCLVLFCRRATLRDVVEVLASVGQREDRTRGRGSCRVTGRSKRRGPILPVTV